MPLTVNIADQDTLANLKGNEPYSSDYYHQQVFATDTKTYHRVLDDGTLSGDITGKKFAISALDQTGSSITVSGLPATPSFIQLFRDGLAMVQGGTTGASFTIAGGGGQLDFPVALADESVTGYYQI